MGFYEQLSLYYDEIFPANADETAFIRSLIRDCASILDLGCGTGIKTVYLAEGKKAAVGIDLDPVMIERAEKDHPAANLRYLVLNMLDIDREFGKHSFDAVLTLGNTLPHLLVPGQLEELFRKAARVLAPGGALVAQIINYDRVLDRRVASLPVVDTEHVVFTRSYAWRDGALRFQTDLTVKADGDTLHNDIELRPIRKRDMAEALAAAGFVDPVFYGNLQGAPYGEDSYHLVVKATTDNNG